MALYGELARVEPTPVVAINRAVAVALAQSAATGLALFDEVDVDRRLVHYQPLHAARAELLRRAGDRQAADAAYDEAIALSSNERERVELRRRRAG